MAWSSGGSPRQQHGRGGGQCNRYFGLLSFVFEMTSNQPSLLVLAAGMGTRYGGLKQLDPVGPNGETIMVIPYTMPKKPDLTGLFFDP